MNFAYSLSQERPGAGESWLSLTPFADCFCRVIVDQWTYRLELYAAGKSRQSGEGEKGDRGRLGKWPRGFAGAVRWSPDFTARM